MGTKNNVEQEVEEELVIVEKDPEEERADEEKPPKTAEDEADAQDDDSDDEEGDSRIAKSESEETSEEREALQARRREEKRQRKLRIEEAKRRDKLELNFLLKRNEDLERRLTAQEQTTHVHTLSAIDSEINKAREEISLAENVIKRAIEAGNGDDVVKAMGFRDAAAARAQVLLNQKHQVMVPQQRTSDVGGLDAITQSHAESFMSRNPWYDPRGATEESAIVLAIDNILHKEGYDSKTPEYWAELERRASKRLPEHFRGREADEDVSDTETKTERKPRGGPQVGSGRADGAPAGGRREVYISPERKQAMIDLGVWDDPVLRNKYVKRYMAYDAEHRT